MDILHAEMQIRSYTFFSWWAPPTPLFERTKVLANDDARPAAEAA